MDTDSRFQLYEKMGGIHQSIESRILDWIQPEHTIGELYGQIYTSIEELMKECRSALSIQSADIAFPIGINRNHCAAHWSPSPSQDPIRIQESDVVKVDYGFHLDGHIFDSAFTFCFQERYRGLIETALRATQSGVAAFTPGGSILRVSETIYRSVPRHYGIIQTLCGHSILPYRIHGGKVVPNYPYNTGYTADPGEIYTVEPFITSKHRGTETMEDLEPAEQSHYMFNYSRIDDSLRSRLEPVVSAIPGLYQRGTLAFHKRDMIHTEQDQRIFDGLLKREIYKAYPPIYTKDTTVRVAQFETVVGIGEERIHQFREFQKTERYVLV